MSCGNYDDGYLMTIKMMTSIDGGGVLSSMMMAMAMTIKERVKNEEWRKKKER